VGLAVTASVALAANEVEQGKSLGRAKLVPIVGGVYYPDTSGRWFKMSSTGEVFTMEAAPSANNYSYQPSVISAVMVPVPDGQMTAGVWTNRDSTTVIDVRGYNRAALLLFPSATISTDKGAGDADSIGGQVLALQVRAHSGAIADSQSTFRVVTQRLSGTVDVPDSIGSLTDMKHFGPTNNAAGVLRNTVLPSEKAVVVTNLLSNGTLGTGDARGMVIWSTKLNDGNSATLPFLSWRLRSVNSYCQTLTAGLQVMTVRDSSNSLPMRVRCDLVLWRE
jgi:hypothetical protein